jgi:hypothetical protein
VSILVALLWALGWTVMLPRFGLLTVAVLASCLDLGMSLPVTMSLDAWYSSQWLWTLVLLFAVATWAYFTSQRSSVHRLSGVESP